MDFGLLRVVRRPSLQNAMGARVSQFEQLSPRPGQIVFLGDSGVENGLWHEWFPTLPCVNRGVGGDTINGVRLRLDSAIYQPRAVALLVGTNDLAARGRRSRRVPEIADALRGLIADIKARAPDSTVLLNSIHPRSRDMSASVRSLNDRYRELAVETGTTYIDLSNVLSSADGSLRTELTFDGLHLNGLGYSLWVDILRPHLEPMGEVQVKPELADGPAG